MTLNIAALARWYVSTRTWDGRKPGGQTGICGVLWQTSVAQVRRDMLVDGEARIARVQRYSSGSFVGVAGEVTRYQAGILRVGTRKRKNQDNANSARLGSGAVNYRIS